MFCGFLSFDIQQELVRFKAIYCNMIKANIVDSVIADSAESSAGTKPSPTPEDPCLMDELPAYANIPESEGKRSDIEGQTQYSQTPRQASLFKSPR